MRVLIRTKGDRNLTLYYVDSFSGREVTKSAGTRDRREAERRAALWEQDLLAFHGRNGDGWDYFRQRFEDEHLVTCAEKTAAGYGTALNHFERLMKPTLVSAVTTATVSGFKAALLREKRKLTSIVNYLTHIRTALNWAAEMKMVQPVKVKLPKQTIRKFMRGRAITDDEYKGMLAACVSVCGQEALIWRRFLELLRYSGMRLAEAIRFSWDSPPVKVLMNSKPFPTIMFYAEGHKAGTDTVSPMTPELHAWLARTPPPQRKGQIAPLPVLAGEASRRISAIGEHCGIIVNDDGKFASAHDLRRAFGVYWAARVRPLTLQRMMRHKDFTTTLKYYIGLDAEDAGAELWSVPTKVPKQGSSSHSSAQRHRGISGKKQGSA